MDEPAEFGDHRLPARFWRTATLDTERGCWLWTGRLDKEGYGHYGAFSCHKAAYRALVGPVTTGKVLDHLCRIRHCCNPAHLEEVTHQVNLRRGFGGGQHELRSPTLRTPPPNATRLWLWMREWGITLNMLARQLGIHAVYLGQVRRGQGRPSDELKERIERVTREIEEQRGVAEPAGVAILDWF
jgi:hypothetical protein